MEEKIVPRYLSLSIRSGRVSYPRNRDPQAQSVRAPVRDPVRVTRTFLNVMLRVSWVLELSCGNAAHCRTRGKSSPPISLHIFNIHDPC